MTNIDPRLEQFAQKADTSVGNNNGAFLDSDEERKEVVKKARDAKIADEEIRAYFEANNVPQDNINSIMGASFTNADEAQTAVSNDTFKRSKSDSKDDRKFLLKEISAVGGKYTNDEAVNWDAMTAELTTRVKNQNPYIKNTLMTQVKTIANLVKAENYDSKESIKAMRKKIKAELKNDENKSFLQDVLDAYVAVAEAHQYQKERTEVSNKYYEMRNNEKEPKTREAAVEALKSEYKSKGSYYSDVIKDFENTDVRQDATKEVWDAINRQRIAEVMEDGKVKLQDGSIIPREALLTSGKDIENAIKNDPNLTLDKYTKSVMRGRAELSTSQQINFEKSTYKANRKSTAAENRVELRKTEAFTEKDFKDALKHDQAFNMLLEKGWITQNAEPDENGNPTYNLSKLSDEIRKKSGKHHFTVDGQKRDYIAYSEVENILKSILAENGEHTDVKFTKKDVVGLAKLCGFDYNGNNFWLNLWKEVPGAIADAAVSLATAAGVSTSAQGAYTGNRGPFNVSLPYSKDVPCTVDYVNNTSFTLKFSTNSNYATVNSRQIYSSLINSGFKAEDISIKPLENGNGFEISVSSSSPGTIDFIKNVQGVADGEVLPEDLGIDFDDVEATSETDKTKALITGIVLTLGLLALRAAMRESGELPVEVTRFENKSYDKYMEELNVAVSRKNITPEQRDALQQIAFAYAKTDDQGNVVSWNSDKYQKMLNEIAGDASFLNKFELAIGADRMARKIEKPAQKEDTPPPAEVVETPQVETPPEDKSITLYDIPGETTSLEYPIMFGDRWDNIIAGFYDISAFKEEAKKAGYPNNFGPKSYTVFFKKMIATDENGNLDAKLFKDLVDGKIPKSIKLPKSIGNCARKVDTFDEKTVEKVTPEGTPVGYTGAAGFDRSTKDSVGVEGSPVRGSSEHEAVSNYNDMYGTNYNPSDSIHVKRRK